MNTLFIIVLCIAEIINLYWTIFIAPVKIDANVIQQVGWIILTGFLFIMMIGYFLSQEERENGEKENKTKKREK